MADYNSSRPVNDLDPEPDIFQFADSSSTFRTPGGVVTGSMEERFQFLEETLSQSQDTYFSALNPVREWDDFESWFEATSPENIVELVPGPNGQPIEVSEKAMDSARFAFYDRRPVGEALARGGFEPSASELRAVIGEIDREQQAIFRSRFGENALPTQSYYLGAPDELVKPPAVLEMDNGGFVEVPAEVMDRAQTFFYQDPERDDFRAAVGLDYSDDQAEAIFEHLMHQRLQMQGALRENDLTSFFDESSDAAVVWHIERGLSPTRPIDLDIALEASTAPDLIAGEFQEQALWGSVERGAKVDIPRPGPALDNHQEQLVLPDWWDFDDPREPQHENQQLADPPAPLLSNPQQSLQHPSSDEPSWYRDDFDSPSFDLDL